MIKQVRHVPISDIPSTLWNVRKKYLLLPPCLSLAYSSTIKAKGLENISRNRDQNNPPVGGMAQEDADRHFAQAFDGSVARAILAILDPKDELQSTSNELISFFSGGNITFVDLPCGACATLFGFLCTIADLRKNKVLPRNPLNVDVIAGDISQYAKDHAKSLFNLLNHKLEEQSIFIEIQFEHWNVVKRTSNRKLVKKVLLAQNRNDRHFMILSNFSGFLTRENKFNEAMKQIEELFEYASDEETGVLWIEPQTKRATDSGGLFSRIFNKLKEWSHFVHQEETETDQTKQLMSSASFIDPLYQQDIHRVHIALIPIRLRSRS